MLHSILAGILISIGCCLFINVPNPILGSLLFSLGLLSVCAFGLKLYTGKIGYIASYKEIPSMLAIIVGNIFGCLVVALVTCIGVLDASRLHTIVIAKLACPVQVFFLKSILCGALMFFGVHAWKVAKLWPVTILCVMAFILGGFEHSIADSFYFIAGECPLDGATRILAAIAGNAIGGIGCYQLAKERK